MFRGSEVQNLEEKCFSVKTWINIKKICLRQRKMNGNYWTVYYIRIQYHLFEMDSDIINGSVVTDETVIAKILNKNQWCHHGKMLT